MIIALDKEGNPLGYPNFIELQWNRRFNGFGDFSLYMPISEYDSNIKYVQNIGRPETGIVQKIVYEQKPEGDFITLSGYFVEWLLNWGALWKDKNYTATTAAGVRTHIRRIVRDGMTLTVPPTIGTYTDPEVKPTNTQLYTFSLNASMPTPSTMNLAYVKGTPCGDAILSWLNANDYSMTANPVWNTSGTGPYLGIDLVTYTGTDRTSSVFFGKPYANVASVEYVLDESAERAEYILVQEINGTQAGTYSGVTTLSTSEGTKQYVFAHTYTVANTPSDMGGSYPMKVLYTSAGSDPSISQADLATQMRQEGRIDMLDNYKLETVTVDVLQNSFIYLTDYDLGDTVSIVIPEINLTFTAQIMEVYEVQSNNNLEVQIVLGTPKRRPRNKGAKSNGGGSGLQFSQSGSGVSIW